MVSTPFAAPTTIYSPNDPPPGNGIGPPPGLGKTLPPPPRGGARSGSYAGTAEPLTTGGGICIRSHAVTGWHVNGNAVRFGGYRGTIDPEGGVQMTSGGNWIFGQFEGGTFRGQSDLNSWRGPGCTYVLNLTRVGP